MVSITANGKRNGRPPKEIDWKEFEQLCFLQCSLREIAAWFHCSEDTIERKVSRQYGECFADVYSKKKTGGLISLRRNMVKMSEHNPAVAIFLAKNWLGMADKQELEVANKDVIENLSDADLEQIIASRRSRGVATPQNGKT